MTLIIVPTHNSVTFTYNLGEWREENVLESNCIAAKWIFTASSLMEKHISITTVESTHDNTMNKNLVTIVHSLSPPHSSLCLHSKQSEMKWMKSHGWWMWGHDTHFFQLSWMEMSVCRLQSFHSNANVENVSVQMNVIQFLLSRAVS